MSIRKGHRGITLIELCVGLAVVAVLAGMAAPGFRTTLRAAAVRTAAYELMAGVQQTRAEAIVESRTGVLCASDETGGCLAGAASAHAWRAFLETGGQPRELSAKELPPGIALRSSRASVRYWPSSLAASTATLTICDESGVARPRAIVISQGGRARFASHAASACG
jgi:type IV fimbrial biogenesis protein FimT